MVQKRDISIDHASNIIACIDVEKSNFKEEMLQHVPIYVIDGNHNIKAQTIAFERTNDWIFKHRMVHVYCNLSPEEALILGTSRNEDSSTVLKFTDFEKVDLIHRYLYTSAKKPLSDEPPEPQKGFTTIYKQLLNLKTKKEVDARAIIRLLATKLSSRNYGLFCSICKNTNIKASRFECLRGLDEEHIFRTLSILEKSGRTRNDWKRFRESSLTHKKDFKKRSTVQISFNHMNSKADITTNERKILQDCVCFAFTSGDGRTVQTLSATELESLVFAAKTDTQTHHQQDTSDVSILKDVHVSVESDVSDVGSRCDVSDVESRIDDLDVESKSSDDHSIIPDTPRKMPKRGSNQEIERSENTCTYRQDSFYPVTPKKDERSEYSCNSSPSVTPQKDHLNLTENLPLGAKISLFLHQLAGEQPARRAEARLTKIEEDEVETKPQLLFSYASVLLDPTVQRAAKQFFDEDAWLLVVNTLKVLEEQFVFNIQRQEKMKFTCKGKGKALLGTKVVNSKKMQGHNTKKSCKRNAYSFTSDEASPLKSFKEACEKAVNVPVSDFVGSERAANTREENVRNCKVRLTDIGTVKDIKTYICKPGKTEK